MASTLIWTQEALDDIDSIAKSLAVTRSIMHRMLSRVSLICVTACLINLKRVVLSPNYKIHMCRNVSSTVID